jgi:hypothetical protein
VSNPEDCDPRRTSVSESVGAVAVRFVRGSCELAAPFNHGVHATPVRPMSTIRTVRLPHTSHWGTAPRPHGDSTTTAPRQHHDRTATAPRPHRDRTVYGRDGESNTVRRLELLAHTSHEPHRPEARTGLLYLLVGRRGVLVARLLSTAPLRTAATGLPNRFLRSPRSLGHPSRGSRLASARRSLVPRTPCGRPRVRFPLVAHRAPCGRWVVLCAVR